MRELATCPPPSSGNRAEDAATLAALTAGARSQQRRWGCPAAGHTPHATLPDDLASEAQHVARVTGTPLATTCPMACVERASDWLLEITTAVSLAADWHVPLPDTLGRELTAADITALSALKGAQGAAMASDRAIEQQKRDAEAAARKR